MLMRRPYANDPRHLYRTPPSGVLRVLLIAFGTALLIGLASGVMWIAFNLVRLHLFR